MEKDTEEYPRPVDWLPERPLELGNFQKFHELESVRRILVPRVSSPDATDCPDSKLRRLSVGLIPTTDITKFVLEARGSLAIFEFDETQWHLIDVHDREEMDTQFLVHQLKPFVSFDRILHAERLRERF